MNRISRGNLTYDLNLLADGCLDVENASDALWYAFFSQTLTDVEESEIRDLIEGAPKSVQDKIEEKKMSYLYSRLLEDLPDVGYESSLRWMDRNNIPTKLVEMFKERRRKILERMSKYHSIQ